MQKNWANFPLLGQNSVRISVRMCQNILQKFGTFIYLIDTFYKIQFPSLKKKLLPIKWGNIFIIHNISLISHLNGCGTSIPSVATGNGKRPFGGGWVFKVDVISVASLAQINSYVPSPKSSNTIGHYSPLR